MLDRVYLNHNEFGLVAHGASGATTRVQITNSTVSGSSTTSVVSQTGAQPTTVILASSLLSANAFGAVSSGPGAAMILNGNTITNNATAMLADNGGAIFSYGNNAINDNGSPGTAPTPVALR